jgi:hypothetical protein
MAQQFKVGDHVAWNDEHNELHGRVVRVITGTEDFGVRSRRHGTPDEPEYEIQRDDRNDRAVHPQSLLRRID